MIKTLTLIGSEDAVEPLIKQLADKDPAIRARIIETLGNLQDRRATGPIIKKSG
nr:HEAT repeat domain-containing protein [Methanosarcina horonobensis]